MKLFKKLFAVVLCFALVLGALPITTFSADGDSIDKVPAPLSSEVVIATFSEASGVRTYASNFKTFRNNARTTFADGVTYNIADLGFVELDWYVSDITKFKKLAELGQGLFVTIGSKAYSRRYWGRIDEYITQNGWNHVKIDFSDFTKKSGESTADLTAINHFSFEFADVTEVKESAIPEEYRNQYRWANLCATIKEKNDYELPYNPIVNVGENRSEVFITWFSNVDTKGKVILSENGVETVVEAFDFGISDAGDVYYNRAKLTGLKKNTDYTYRLGAGEAKSTEYKLNIGNDEDEFSFIQITDIQLPSNNKYLTNWNNTLNRINEYFPDSKLIVNTGDVSDSCKTALYGYFKSPKTLSNYIMSVVPGNHDNSPNSYYDEHFTAPDNAGIIDGYGANECDYWYGYNNVLFISLNTNIKDSNYHKEYITKVVEEQGDNYKWIIVNCHHSLFSASYHRSESDVKSFRENLAPFYSEIGVDMVLSGHDHCYDRSYMMQGTTPNVSEINYGSTSNGQVLYISAQSGSALKFNEPEPGSRKYSAKIVEETYGFINYEVTDESITLTYYSTADMSVLDKFTLYKDGEDSTVEPDNDLLGGKDLQDIELDDDGKYTVQFDEPQDISNSCAVEFGLKITEDSASDITVALIDGDGNSINKTFSGVTKGWKKFAFYVNEMTGVADLTDIVALEVTGTAGAVITLTNLYIGHIYLDEDDLTCEACDFEREIYVDPMTVPAMKKADGMLTVKEGEFYWNDLGTKAIDNDYLPGDRSYTGRIEKTNFREYATVEFDFYIHDIDNFKARVSDMNLLFVHEDDAHVFADSYYDQITQSGWNHIVYVMPTSFAESWHAKKVIRFRFYTTMSAGDVGVYDEFMIANIGAYKSEINLIPDMITADCMRVFAEGELYADAFGSKEVNNTWLPGGNGSMSRFEKTNFRDYDTIEFDVYIQNLDNFKARVSSMNFLFVHDDDAHYFAIEYINQITQSGWNHIKIDIPDTYTESWHAKKVIRFRFYITMSAGDVGATDCYKIANVVAVTQEHNNTTVVTEPTCADIGYTTHTCLHCGNSYVTDEVAVLSHDHYVGEDGNKYCNGCDYGNVAHIDYVDGAYANGYGWADLNNDGYINYTDLELLNAVVCNAQFGASDMICMAADVNGDGVIDMKDIVRIKKIMGIISGGGVGEYTTLTDIPEFMV